MLALPTWSLALLVAASPIMAQTMNVAQRLGYPANAKLLILHADDLGVAHSVNVASLDALERGAITSASVMMPTPSLLLPSAATAPRCARRRRTPRRKRSRERSCAG